VVDVDGGVGPGFGDVACHDAARHGIGNSTWDSVGCMEAMLQVCGKRDQILGNEFSDYTI
jgi:hypothetical protein